MSIPEIYNTQAPTTPTRNYTTPPGTPKKRPLSPSISPSICRRIVFTSPSDTTRASEKRAKLYKGGSSVSHVASPVFRSSPSMPPATSCLSTVPLQSVSPILQPSSPSVPAPSSNSAVPLNAEQNLEVFSLHKASMRRVHVPSTRLGLSVPKIDMDFATQQKSLTWRKKRYELTPISTGDIARQHWVWLGKTPDASDEVVFKTYHHNENLQHRESLMKADRIGYDIWQNFLNNHSFPGIRLCKIHSMLEEGVLVTEYVKVDKEKLEFWNEWKNGKSLECLSKDAMTILKLARNVMEVMWKEKIDLGDFRAENTIWKEGQLHVIDWQYIPPTESGDLVRNLKSYIKDWAKDNPAVHDFLTQSLADLMKASTVSAL